MDIKEDFEAKMNAKAAAVDDDDLIKLRNKHIGQMLCDKDDGQCFRVLEVNYVQHGGHNYWMATSIPVVSVGGCWVVEDRHLARGATQSHEADRDNEVAPIKVVYLHESLEYFSLARVHGPGKVSYHDDVDVMMEDFAL